MANLTLLDFFRKPGDTSMPVVDSLYQGRKMAQEYKKGSQEIAKGSQEIAKGSQEIAKNEFELARQMYEKNKLKAINDSYEVALRADGTIDPETVMLHMTNKGYGKDALAEALTTADAHNKMIQIRANTGMMKDMYGITDVKPYTNEYSQSEVTPTAPGSEMDLGSARIVGKVEDPNFYNRVEASSRESMTQTEPLAPIQTSGFSPTATQALTYEMPNVTAQEVVDAWRTTRYKRPVETYTNPEAYRSWKLSLPYLKETETADLNKYIADRTEDMNEKERKKQSAKLAQIASKVSQGQLAIAQQTATQSTGKIKDDINSRTVEVNGQKLTFSNTDDLKRYKELTKDLKQDEEIYRQAENLVSKNPKIKAEAERYFQENESARDQLIRAKLRAEGNTVITNEMIESERNNFSTVQIGTDLIAKNRNLGEGFTTNLLKNIETNTIGAPINHRNIYTVAVAQKAYKDYLEKNTTPQAEVFKQYGIKIGAVAKDGRGVKDVISPKATGTTGNKTGWYKDADGVMRKH